MESVTFVTPSYAGDYARFVFQRESMVRCGIDVPHVVIVHDEDVGLFESTPDHDGLTVLSSRDVLPRDIESLRLAGYVSGWHGQQLTKLAAADVVDTDYVCVDSDTFWVRPVGVDDFRTPGGKLRLFEQHWLSAEIVSWLAGSLTAWRVDRGEHIEPVSWVYPIVPLARDLVSDLRVELEGLHGMDWARVLLESKAVEYSMYGVYARYVRRLDRVVPTEPDLCVGYWKPQFERFDALAETIAADNTKKAVMVHSHLGVSPDDYRATVEPVWRALNG
jgi:hypothetical protein